jgi:alpha/beta superfamily hydrolase
VVLAGQFLERSVVIPSGGLLLDGLYHRGGEHPPCALAAPHPALGGSMTAPVVAELAWALTRAGHPTLRFDYRGVGGSQGKSRHRAGGDASLALAQSALSRPQLSELDPVRLPRAQPAPARRPLSELADEAADLMAAAEQLLATAPARSLCLVGYSFGAAVALACAGDPRVEELVLVAPPTRLFDFSSLAQLDKPVLAVLAEHDVLSASDDLRLAAQGTVTSIAHADHGFRRGMRELGHEVVEWLWRGRPRKIAVAQGEAEVGAAQSELELPEGDEPPLELLEE